MPPNAICRYDESPGSYSGDGPYRTRQYFLPSNSTPAATTVYYPTDAEPPFASIVFCPPFLTPQIAFAPWGPWFASHGFVLVTMNTNTILDPVDRRDFEQWSVVTALKEENSREDSPLNGLLDLDRMGVMGWSMGGGATWINAADHGDELRTAMTLAGHNLTSMDSGSKGKGIDIPTLILNGARDNTFLGGLGQSDRV